MRYQQVVRVVDATASQGRTIIWMTCKHTDSVTDILRALSPMIKALKPGDQWPCLHCPDPPPEPPKMVEKTARQLWKDAGEP